ncbi:MAG: FAD-dependent oxidoreductase [Chloroflexi bacterium]|nr:FAD-dependent oxidoreductase [Chloroflexota bacterium]
MASQFEYLFSPFQLGKINLRNRIVFLPHLPLYAENHMPVERDEYYYGERAKGGAALCIYGCQSVQEGSTFGAEIYANDERVIPGYRKVAERVHGYGGKIFTQITHYGNQSPSGSTLDLNEWKPILAPSDVPDGIIGEIPKILEEEEIWEIIGLYAKAAKNSREGGMDGVEIKCAHDGLLRQFLSPYYNQRTDQWGGSVENRTRFVRETIKAVRAAVGDDYTFGVRLCLDEFIPGGYGLDEAMEFAKAIVGTGVVDYINGDMGVFVSCHMVTPSMALPLGFALYSTAALKEAVDLPVIAFGRINDPVQSEKALAEGQADLIGMARALICDPHLPNKAKEGRIDDIRNCVGCNQGCYYRVFLGKPITCMQNPSSGREKELADDTLKPATTKKNVLVVGGGPGGMKAAEIAATRGHQVTIYDKGETLGGQFNLALKVPKLQYFGGTIRYIQRELDKLGVKQVLGKEVSADEVIKQNPDAVVVATGSVPRMPAVPGVDQDNVLTVWELLQGKGQAGNKVVVIDAEGFWQSTGVIEMLAEQGKQVEVVVPGANMGGALDIPSQLVLFPNLYSRDVVVSPNESLKSIDGNTVTVANVWSGKERKIEGVDTVILATGYKANEDLYFALKGKVKELHRVGDCVAPRRADNAILDGILVGRQI